MGGAVKPGQTIQGKGTGTVQPSRPTIAPTGQGSTLPPQGGKGGAQNPDGTNAMNLINAYQQQIGVQPGQTMNPQQLGQMNSYMQTLQQQQPNNTFLNPNPVGATQQPIPAQGGKFPANPQQPTTSNIPGYAQPYVNALNPQQPGQVPAQGGKAPLTPEQHAAISANADPARGLGLNLGDMLYGGGGQQPQVQPQVQQPAPVIPRPAMTRPVMPRPTMTRPSSIGAGLAALRGRR